MISLKTLYPQSTWALITQTFEQSETLSALAHTNALLNFSVQSNQPIIHFWTLPQNVILGMMDTKLPQYEQATRWLVANHYSYAVRNAGGLGVVSNQGVLNISCYLPNIADQLTINSAYDLIQDWLTTTFATKQAAIKSFEVTNSYCPGRYDLSINGQKFAGIAQRRRKNGVAISLYISVTGDQPSRGQLMQNFYQVGQAPLQTSWHFPEVEPTSMANLADLLAQPLTPELVQKSLLATLQTQYQLRFATHSAAILSTPEYQQSWTKQLAQLDRYQNH